MDNTGKKSLIRNSNFQDALFVGACSVTLLVYSLYHHHFDRNTTEWKTSPFLFPTLISVFGLLLVTSLLADAFQDMKAGPAEAAEEDSGKKNPKGAVVFIAASILYYILLPLLHFIPATILYLAGLFIYLGERKWWKILLLSAITAGMVYVLFGMGLNVRLP
ncbi:MAG: tripartite tricarboxylate transporter TctB family protein [Stomatobaculum sp.]|nr:tripartite tricarboxylate transporter TctB family protein [Stomatobaculum sp.]